MAFEADVDVEQINQLLSGARNQDHHSGKTFTNPWPSFASKGFVDMFKCLSSFRKVEILEDKKPPVVEPDWAAIANPPADDIQVTWLGHASFLIQMEGANILTDPHFSHRCAPVQFAGPARYTPVPPNIENLPPIDIVIISHNHYDHLDSNTVEMLEGRGKKPQWFVPLGIKAWLTGAGVAADNVTELDWWHAARFGRLAVVCTPCQHFSGRTLLDKNKTLWSSWAILSARKRFWFAGDTGYRTVPQGFGVTDGFLLESQEALDSLPRCPAFAQIGERLGPFDLACIPIGAYSPRWFMSPIHLNPEDAVDVHLEVRARRSVGMHWGTFVLTDEPIWEPPTRLSLALKRKGLTDNDFFVLKHGETTCVKKYDQPEEQKQAGAEEEKKEE
eukprot:TRINITY_DN10406_c0_g2_i2.p1 TRINITY_DN10406_c0_g2~~TRINITY_DN10406_c0_g2_i2.p1  ORF type:complete len:388 (-),score=97.42 TRINITY_DN10406_c0_g2_i2:95-1258(-)